MLGSQSNIIAALQDHVRLLSTKNVTEQPSMDKCQDFFYTIEGSNETCTGTWEELHATPLLIIRIVFITIWSTLLVLYTKPVILFLREKDPAVRKQQKFKRSASIFFIIGIFLNLLGYLTRNVFYYPLNTALGFISLAGIQLGSVLFFGGVGCIMLMIQQVFLSSCNGNMQAVILTSYAPMWRFTLPYLIAVFVVFVAILTGEITSGVYATRLTLLCAVLPTVIYGSQVTYYIGPVIAALESTISSQICDGTGAAPTQQKKDMAAKIQERVNFLRDQKKFVLGSCIGSCIIFLAIGLAPWMHQFHGTFFLVMQSYNSFLMSSAVTLVLKLLSEHSKKKKKYQVSPVKTAKTELRTVPSSTMLSEK